jgi:hypothetical protein
MRYKIVPEPLSREDLLEARDTLPLVPGSVEDCCTRIRDGTALQSRDAARELLTFMQALGLAAESQHGFHRVRGDVADDDLGTAFVENVFGARELVDALQASDDPLTPSQALGVIRADIPQWERARYPDWEAEWRERVERLLEWATVFGLADAADSGYRASGR